MKFSFRIALLCAVSFGLSGVLHAQPPGPPPAFGDGTAPPPPPGGFPAGGPPPGAFPAGGPPGAPPPGGKPISLEQLQAKMKEIMLMKAPPPKVALAPVPTDPHNLEGAYIGNQLTQLRTLTDMNGQSVPANDKAKAILARRVKGTYEERKPYGNAAGLCLPPGQPWQLGVLYPFQIYQTKSATIFVFSEYHTQWAIRMNAKHRAVKEYMGDSVGHWEGDTLVVDTVGFKQPLWLDADGSPGSADTHLTFRIRRIKDGQQLEIITTIDDPVYYKAPWSMAHTYAWRPDMEFFNEYDCETQLSGPDAFDLFGLRPEPKED